MKIFETKLKIIFYFLIIFICPTSHAYEKDQLISLKIENFFKNLQTLEANFIRYLHCKQTTSKWNYDYPIDFVTRSVSVPPIVLVTLYCPVPPPILPMKLKLNQTLLVVAAGV